MVGVQLFNYFLHENVSKSTSFKKTNFIQTINNNKGHKFF